MDIFDIVQHFEHCNFWTAFQILGGTDEVDKKTEELIQKARIEKEKQIQAEKKKKEKNCKK